MLIPVIPPTCLNSGAVGLNGWKVGHVASMGVRFRWKLPALWTVSEELGRRVCVTQEFGAALWRPALYGGTQGGTGFNGPMGLFVLVGCLVRRECP